MAWWVIARSIVVGITLFVWTAQCEPAYAADLLSVTILADGSEIISADLKRLRRAGPAEIHFRFTTDDLKRLYGDDLTKPRDYLRLVVQSSERRVLGAMTGAQATGAAGPHAVMTEVDRQVSDLGLTVERHTLRYEFLPGYTR